MPESLSYLQAIGAAALASTAVLIAIDMRRLATAWSGTACALAIGVGLAVGCYMVSLYPNWPPFSALDRLFMIVVPVGLLIEWIASIRLMTYARMWLLRIAFALTVPRVLLHGSVYLSDTGDWTLAHSALAIVVSGLLLIGVWSLLALLSQRRVSVSIPLALCLAMLSAGVTVMMAGYIHGGTAACLFAAVLLGTTTGLSLIGKHRGASQVHAVRVDEIALMVVGFGVLSLFGVLFIGRFFGRISTGMALTILLAPLLCWATETMHLGNRNPWLVGSLRLALVAIPLAIVLAVAKGRFDREMSPLLGKVEESISQFHARPERSSADWAIAPFPARAKGSCRERQTDRASSSVATLSGTHCVPGLLNEPSYGVGVHCVVGLANPNGFPHCYHRGRWHAFRDGLSESTHHYHAELEAVRLSAQRGKPLGDEGWVESIARRLSLESTMRPRGRKRVR